MTSSIKWLYTTRLQKAKNILETRDTLSTTIIVHDKDQEVYSHSAFGALPFVWLRALGLQLCVPSPQRPGEWFLGPLSQCFILLFPYNCSCAVSPRALHLQTPAVWLWWFSKEVTATGHCSISFPSPSL